MRMTSGMKRKVAVLAACLVVGLFPAAVYAAEASTLVSTINGWGNGLAALADNSTVTVTGTAENVVGGLTLDIDSGVTVKWNATLTGSFKTSSPVLLSLSGSGAFEMTGGRIEYAGHNLSPAYNGNAILVNGSNTLTLTGGAVKTDSTRRDCAAIQFANDSTGAITVNGAKVTSGHTGINHGGSNGTSPVITMKSGEVNGSGTDGYGIYAASTNAPVISFEGGTVTGKDTIRCFNGTVNLSGTGATLDGAGVVLTAKTINVTEGSHLLTTTGTNAVLITGGALTVEAGASLSVASNNYAVSGDGDSTVSVAGTLEVGGNSGFYGCSALTVDGGVLRVDVGGTITSSLTFTIGANGGHIVLSGNEYGQNITNNYTGGHYWYKGVSAPTASASYRSDVIDSSSARYFEYVSANHRVRCADTNCHNHSVGAPVIHKADGTTGNCVCGFNPLTVTVSQSPNSYTYGDTDVILSATVTRSDSSSIEGATYAWTKDGQSVSGAASSTLDISGLDAGDYTYTCTVTVDGYKKASENFAVAVNKAPAPAPSIVTVSRNYALGKVSVPTGIVGTVMVGAATGSGAGKVSEATIDDKGNLTFTLSGGANGDEVVLPVSIQSPNYAGTITATVTVTLTDKLDQRSLTVNAASPTVPSGGTVELSATGGSGRGAVTYEVVSGTGSASVSGGSLTGGSPGTVTVIATKAGTGQYNPSRSQPLVITVE